MLGVNSRREPVKGHFASVVKESLHRGMTGNLTADERKARESLKNAQLKWKMVWKD